METWWIEPIDLPDGLPPVDEVVVKVRVPMTGRDESTRPTLGVALSAMAGIDSTPVSRGYGNYLLIQWNKDGSEDAHWVCTFGKPKTSTDQITAQKEWYDREHYEWPAVLTSFAFTPDDQFPLVTQKPESGGGLTTVFASQLYERVGIREAWAGHCRVRKRVFLSPTKFPDNLLVTNEPVAGNVNWSFNGSSGSLKCLHDDLVVVARGKPYQTVDAAASYGNVQAPSAERFFEATNMVDWQPFKINTQRQLPSGLWMRYEMQFYPPDDQPDLPA